MSILTETHDETTRRLQLLGIPGDVIPRLITYVDALNLRQLATAQTTYPHLFGYDTPAYRDPSTGLLTDLIEFYDVDPGATGAGKYVQIVAMAPSYRTGETVPGSVHSVVVKADGRVCKAAGWKGGPVKSTAKATKGQIIARYSLTDADSLAALVKRISDDPGSVHGGYLYAGGQ